MSHHIYHTPGIIIGSKPLARASKTLYVFTRDLGLVNAKAQGIRELRSKLRFHLQDFSLLNISLVHGRAGWHIVGANLTRNFYEEWKRESEKLQVVARIFKLLRRLLRGEEGNPELFSIVISGMEYLEKLETDEVAVSNLEVVLVLRILHNLGYVADAPTFGSLINPPTDWNNNFVTFPPGRKREVVKFINKALVESQL